MATFDRVKVGSRNRRVLPATFFGDRGDFFVDFELNSRDDILHLNDPERNLVNGNEILNQSGLVEDFRF